MCNDLYFLCSIECDECTTISSFVWSAEDDNLFVEICIWNYDYISTSIGTQIRDYIRDYLLAISSLHVRFDPLSLLSRRYSIRNYFGRSFIRDSEEKWRQPFCFDYLDPFLFISILFEMLSCLMSYRVQLPTGHPHQQEIRLYTSDTQSANISTC